MKTKTDARKLDGATQANLLRLVVKALRGGMRQTVAAGRLAVGFRAVNKLAALDKAGGLRGQRAPQPKRRARRAEEGRLDATQSGRTRALIVGKDHRAFLAGFGDDLAARLAIRVHFMASRGGPSGCSKQPVF
jgi:hypothetical protein